LTNRPFKELSDRLLSKIEDINRRAIYKLKSREKFSDSIDTMLYNLKNHLESNGSDLKDIVDKKDSLSGQGWIKNIGEIRTSYGQIYVLNKELMDTEKTIHRIERKAHFRALIFRFLTTLFIGFGIMIVYYVAQEIGVNMPLIKIPA
jgi:hypothetical protein